MTNDTRVFCLYYTNVFLLIQKDNVDTEVEPSDALPCAWLKNESRGKIAQGSDWFVD